MHARILSDKQSGVTLSTYADFGDMNEDLWRRVDLAHASRIDRYGPAEINRYEVWDLVDRYGPPEIHVCRQIWVSRDAARH